MARLVLAMVWLLPLGASADVFGQVGKIITSDAPGETLKAKEGERQVVWLGFAAEGSHALMAVRHGPRAARGVVGVLGGYGHSVTLGCRGSGPCDPIELVQQRFLQALVSRGYRVATEAVQVKAGEGTRSEGERRIQRAALGELVVELVETPTGGRECKGQVGREAKLGATLAGKPVPLRQGALRLQCGGPYRIERIARRGPAFAVVIADPADAAFELIVGRLTAEARSTRDYAFAMPIGFSHSGERFAFVQGKGPLDLRCTSPSACGRAQARTGEVVVIDVPAAKAVERLAWEAPSPLDHDAFRRQILERHGDALWARHRLGRFSRAGLHPHPLRETKGCLEPVLRAGKRSLKTWSSAAGCTRVAMQVFEARHGRAQARFLRALDGAPWVLVAWDPKGRAAPGLPRAWAQTLPEVVARVNDQPVPAAALRDRLRERSEAEERKGRSGGLFGDPLRSTLKALIDEAVVEQAAQRRGLKLGVSASTAEGRQRLIEALVDADPPVVEEAKIKALIERSAEPRGELQLRYRQIQLRLGPEREERERAAAEVARKARAGADFAALSREETQGPYAVSGGFAGKRALSRIRKGLRPALQAAKPGEILGPIQLRDGHYILKLEARLPPPKPEPLSREKAVAMATQMALYEARSGLMKRLRDAARIEVLLPAEPAESEEAPPRKRSPIRAKQPG